MSIEVFVEGQRGKRAVIIVDGKDSKELVDALDFAANQRKVKRSWKKIAELFMNTLPYNGL